jgi:regulatory protein
MTITKITSQVKNPDRVNIFVDSKYRFSLTINQVIDEKVKIGQELDDSKIKYFEKISAEGKQKIKALEWLMIRPHSEKEFKEYLYRKKIDTSVGKSWQVDFIKHGYLNNENFAKWWVDNRKRKNKSTRFIKSELMQKGISAEIINNLLADHEITDDEALKKLIITKQRQARYADQVKLTSYLVGKGFSYSRVKALLAGEND